MTDYVFSWDKLLSFQGNTAPYLQNAYVRIRSIFRRLDQSFDAPEFLTLKLPEERVLAVRLLQFGEIVPLVLGGFSSESPRELPLRCGDRLSRLL